MEGAIAAQDLTIGGRFKGTIQANRVTLTSSAVVEAEIHHRHLAIEENAWFAGVSCPQKATASEVTNTRSPVQLVPTNGNRQINGSLREVAADITAKEQAEGSDLGQGSSTLERALAIARKQQAKSWGTPRRNEPRAPLA